MSDQIITSDLLVDLSTEQQQLVTGGTIYGYGYGRFGKFGGYGPYGRGFGSYGRGFGPYGRGFGSPYC
ncbi:hypothetical protein A6770_30155 [Nostoc minutum NIES-26]|uniref:Uncharacterized protein n=1 Tax=Nostoc minutum NIES-26 TaxID=1844469 RepID=A0A367QEV0_9NOSO|nr:hypothetical protein A6770_30155 [Nostoc minutum NIES-26]